MPRSQGGSLLTRRPTSTTRAPQTAGARPTSPSADRAYDSNAIRANLASSGIVATIPPTRARNKPIPFDEENYKRRHLAENLFADLKQFCGLATRDCKLVERYQFAGPPRRPDAGDTGRCLTLMERASISRCGGEDWRVVPAALFVDRLSWTGKAAPVSDILPFVIALGVAIAFGHALYVVSGWTRNVNRDRRRFRRFMRTMREEISEIKGQISAILDILQRVPQPVVVGASPLRLTEFGERIAECLGAKEWATQFAEGEPFEVLQVMQPFQIDEFAANHVAERLDDDISKKVAQCAYEFGIERDAVLPALRVVLRDALLARVGA